MRGRAAYHGRAWHQAAAALGAADVAEGLGSEDLTMLAQAASSVVTQQAVCGRTSGRFTRMRLLLPVAQAHYAVGRYLGTLEVARSAEEIGRRHRENDLVAFAQHSQGRALLRLERLHEGLAVLDEVFVEVFPAGLTSPVLTGLVACSVVEGCQQVGAFDRAGEWTAALSAWCDEQPELVPFSGECLVHRAEVLLRRGHWHDSLSEARSAARCAERDARAATAAAAAYQQGEALRRLGRMEDAERAYVAAQQGGHDPMPGLARLRLEQHRGQTALASLHRALVVTHDPLQRAQLLPAAVEVLLAADQPAGAAAYVRELSELALRWPARLVWFVRAAWSS